MYFEDDIEIIEDWNSEIKTETDEISTIQQEIPEIIIPNSIDSSEKPENFENNDFRGKLL